MTEGYDERDTIFSRMFELKEDRAEYADYYQRRPELEKTDRRLRDADEGVFSGREIEQRQIEALFSLIEDLRPLAGHTEVQKEKKKKPEIDPDEGFSCLKKSALHLGAVLFGTAETNRSWVYSVRGRGSLYGRRTDDVLPYTIMIAVEMDEAEINRAPAVEQSVEVAGAYLRAAVISLALKRMLNTWGYSAVAHIDGMSQLIMPPAAEAAGLGSIGLNGLLVNPHYGPRIRLSGVTTDMPLPTDNKSKFNVLNYCKTCGRCAASCPSGSIKESGVDHESCFGLWRQMATDCGVCLAACPFSHPKKSGKAGSAKAKDTSFLKDFMFGA